MFNCSLCNARKNIEKMPPVFWNFWALLTAVYDTCKKIGHSKKKKKVYLIIIYMYIYIIKLYQVEFKINIICVKNLKKDFFFLTITFDRLKSSPNIIPTLSLWDNRMTQQKTYRLSSVG